MFRPFTLPGTDTEAEERSMRVVEYALAFIALAAAGVLAFVR